MGFEDAADYSDLFSPQEWDAINAGDFSLVDEAEELEFSDVAPDGERARSAHAVTVYHPPGQYAASEHAYEIECDVCGDVGVADTLEHAQAIARLHEEFVAVVVDQWGRSEPPSGPGPGAGSQPPMRRSAGDCRRTMVTMSEPAYSIDEIRERLPQLLEAVGDGERVVVRRDDGSELVLMSKGDLESLEMTLEILSDPEARQSLERSRAEAKAGLAEPLEKHYPPPS